MRIDNPIETLAASLHAACFRDLPEIEYRDRDWAAHRKFMDSLSKEEKAAYYANEKKEAQLGRHFIEKKRRPAPADCTIDMFPQTWGSTSLGFGGIGGQAFTDAYTVVISCVRTGACAVYFGGRFAYMVPERTSNEQARCFRDHYATHNLAACSAAPELYGAVCHQEGK